MKQFWNAEELSLHWSLSFEELDLLKNKPIKNHIAIAIQLKYYKYFGCFPRKTNEIAKLPLHYVVDQLDISIETYYNYDWNDRIARYHRQEILYFLGIRKLNQVDRDNLSTWLCETVFPNGNTIKESLEYVYEWLHQNKIDRSAEKQLERELNSTYNQFEKELFEKISNDIPLSTIHLKDYCLGDDETETISFSALKSDPGRISLDSVLKEIEKLDFINQLKLPELLRFYRASLKKSRYAGCYFSSKIIVLHDELKK